MNATFALFFAPCTASFADKGVWLTFDSTSIDFIVISFGDYYGEPRWFGVVGNSPDPSEVSIDSGIVSYELAEFWYVDENGSWWDEESVLFDPIAQLKETVEGVMLVQLVDDRTLKVETFPGKSAEDVDGFTSEAILHER